ncbi:MAG: hypothetical protein C4306_07135, partial [Thermoleophilia bacterium]
VAVGPSSLTVAWQTESPTRAWVAAGPPEWGPVLWWQEKEPRLRHRLTLAGLSFSTPYRIWVTTIAGDGERAQASVDATTAGPPAAPEATAGEGAVRADGQPFFPIMSFGGCPETYETSLAAGVNLFVRNPCGGLQAQLDALAGRALSAASAEDGPGQGPGLIGSFYPDEADAHGLSGATLPPPPPGSRGLRFLTLSNHFYSGAAPLAAGRGMYPGLVARADVVGFDLYPLQEWCRPDRLADVYLAQRELVQLARGKPTFQWIEAAGMRCPGGKTAVTPETVRAEAWLAVVGGARGLGFFPPGAWTGEVGAALAEVTRAIRYLAPALLSPLAPTAVDPPSGPVKAGAWHRQGALYVVAVNASRLSRRVTIDVPGLAGRALAVLGEGRSVISSGDTFLDNFGPLATHLYVAAPFGS